MKGMNTFLCICFTLFLFTIGTQGIETDEGVYVLTTDNFESFVDEEGVTLVEFYAPWCGHCKKLTPEYAKAAQELKNSEPAVKLAKVDATVETDLASKFGVSGYPTLKVFRSGSPVEYKGPRDAAGIVAYMKKQAAPAITSIKSLADLEKFIAEEAGIVYFADATSKLSKTFETVAGKLRETFRFGKAEGEELLEKAGHAGDIVIYQSKRYAQSALETAKHVFDVVGGDLSDFIHESIIPLVGELTDDNLALYNKRGKPLFKVYTDLDWKLNPKGANYILNRIRKVARDNKDKFSFVVVPKTKNQKELDDSGLSGDLAFSIFETKKGNKYPGSGAFTPEGALKLIEDFVGGKLEPYFKSEPIPTQTPGEPTIVVGRNFDEIVNDPTKDVLLEAYAPWCGHCKQLEPKYKELAEKLAPYSNTLTIAKIDATANDIPPQFQVKGFPTIFFIPANKKDKPLTYDSQREVKDFISYIKRNAHFPLKEGAGGKDEL